MGQAPLLESPTTGKKYLLFIPNVFLSSAVSTSPLIIDVKYCVGCLFGRSLADCEASRSRSTSTGESEIMLRNNETI